MDAQSDCTLGNVCRIPFLKHSWVAGNSINVLITATPKAFGYLSSYYVAQAEMNDMSNIIVTTYFIYHARGKTHDRINHFKNLIIPRLIEMPKKWAFIYLQILGNVCQ